MNEWVIAWGGNTWSENDLTVQHLTLIVMMGGADSWDISPLKSPLRMLHVLAALIAVAEGRDALVVMGELGSVPLVDLVGAIDVVEG